MIAVAICTHNPDERLLARVLAAVASQTVPPDECLIVDNASDRPVASMPIVDAFLRRFSRARIVVEPKRGLTHARIAAIEQTSAPLVCFVDDDCEPEPGYLAAARRILDEHACIGALGPGRIEVEFVDRVPEWFAQRFRHHFQEKDVKTLAYGCVPAAWTDYYPPGSCLVVRREALERYREAFLAGHLSASDRVGARLASGGDTQIVWEAVKMGLAAGVSPELRIRHMIPAKRSTLRYMKRLLFGTSSSYLPALTGSFPAEARALPAVPSDARIVRGMLRIAAAHLLRGRLKLMPLALATYVGSATGLARAAGVERKSLLRAIRMLRLE